MEGRSSRPSGEHSGENPSCQRRLTGIPDLLQISIQNEHILILDDEIEFIDSDHRKSNRDESQFIQLMAILLGAVYTCLHNESNKHQKKKLGYLFKSTLETLLDRRKHESSDVKIGSYYRSNYRRTYQVAFFPSTEMEDQEFQQRFDLDDLSKGLLQAKDLGTGQAYL